MIIYVIVVYIFKKYIYTYSQPQTIAIGELHIHINIYIRLFFPEGLLHISHSHGFRKDIPQHKSPMVTHPGHPGPLLRQVKDLALYAPSGPKALAIHVRPDQLSVAGSRNQSASLVSMLIYANVFLCFYMFPLFHIDMGWYGCPYIYAHFKCWVYQIAHFAGHCPIEQYQKWCKLSPPGYELVDTPH